MMSSSFVRDCSDLTVNNNVANNKTVIIIVNNETGNTGIDGEQLQNLLASHGADADTQVSVVQMGAGGNGCTTPGGDVATEQMIADNQNMLSMGDCAGLPLAVDNSGGGYAELALDADALKCLESVLKTDEARDILDSQLLNMVTNPDSQFDIQGIDDSSEPPNDEINKSDKSLPKRRSQRQQDKAEREEVVKILAENQLMIRKEQEELEKMAKLKEEEKEGGSNEDNKIESTTLNSGKGKGKKEDPEVEVKKGSKNEKVKNIESENKINTGKGIVVKNIKKKTIEQSNEPEKAKGDENINKTEKGRKGKTIETRRGKGTRAEKLKEVEIEIEMDTETNDAKDLESTSKSIQGGNVKDNKNKNLESDKKIDQTEANPSSQMEGKVIEVIISNDPPINKLKTKNSNVTTFKKRLDVNQDSNEDSTKAIPKTNKGGVKDIEVSQTIGNTALNPSTSSNKEISSKPGPKSKTKHLITPEINSDSIKQPLDPCNEDVDIDIKNTEECHPESNISEYDTKIMKKINKNVNGMKPTKINVVEVNMFSSVSNNKLNKCLKNSNIKTPGKRNEGDEVSDPRNKQLDRLKGRGIATNTLVKVIQPIAPPVEDTNQKVKGKNKVKPKGPSPVKQTIEKRICIPINSPMTEKEKANAKSTHESQNLQRKRSLSQSGPNNLKEKKDTSSPTKKQKTFIAEQEKSTLHSAEKISKKIEIDISENIEDDLPNLEMNKVINKPMPKSKKLQQLNIITQSPGSGEPIRSRSGRQVKKKTFGDEMITFDDNKVPSDFDDSDQDEPPNKQNGSGDEDKDDPDEEDDIEEEEEEDEDDDDDEDEESDDPEKLWCICQKPHNNRFMICCDRCEDWFHGSCVGISKAMGKQVELEGKEWICPNCKKADKSTTPEKNSSNPINLPSLERSSSKLVTPKTTVIPVFQKKEDDQEKKSESAKSDPRVLVYEVASGKVLTGGSAPTLSILKDWLKEHPGYKTVQPGMMNKATGTVMKAGLNSIEKRPGPASKTTPTVKIIPAPSTLTSPSLSSPLTSKTFYSKSPKEKIPTTPTNSKPETKISSSKKEKKEKEIEIKKPEPEKYKPPLNDIRGNVRKSLADSLTKRALDAKPDLVNVKSDFIIDLCEKIERKLYEFFNKDVGMKYKSRYRSMLFNIRDTKNNGLFRKILNGDISPSKLAKMTSEEFASKELAEWREREGKKELEAIQKHELDMISLGNQYIMKSHKGEIEIDKDDFIRSKERAPETVATLPDTSSHSSYDEIMRLHDQHIYDENCKICNKKLIMETEESIKEQNKNDYKSKKSRHKDKSRDRSRDRKDTKDKNRDSKNSSRDKISSHRKDRHSQDDRNRRKDDDISKSKDKYSKDDRKKHDRRSSTNRDGERRSSTGSHKSSSSSRHRHDSRDGSRRKRDTKSDHKSSNGLTKSSGENNKSDKEDKVSTSEDVVSSINSHVTSSEADMEPTSTVLGSPKLFEEEGDDIRSPGTPPVFTSYQDNFGDYPDIQLDLEKALPTLKMDVNTTTKLPPVPESIDIDNIPSYNSPKTPPIPTNDAPLSPRTPPLPSSTPPLPSTTPPLPSSTPPLPSSTPPITDGLDEPNSPLTPPLPESMETNSKVVKQIWKGIVSMPDVARFSAAAFEVSGDATDFTEDVPGTMDIVGRITTQIVWDYLAQTKKLGSKEILVVRFQPSSEEEKHPYIALYSYLSNKRRYAVVGTTGTKGVKDFYVVPLASHQPIPQVLLPLDGPGFEEHRPHMLIGVIVRSRSKITYNPLVANWVNPADQYKPKKSKKVDDEYSPSKVFSDPNENEPSDNERSYTPPPASKEPPKRIASPTDIDTNTKRIKPIDDDEPYIPPGMIELEMEEELQNSALKSPDANSILGDKTIDISDSEGILDADENEAYSPSRPCSTLNLPNTEANPVNTGVIDIPSNLHEILKNFSSKDSDGNKESKEDSDPDDLMEAVKDLDLRPFLKQTSKPKDEDMRTFQNPPAPIISSESDTDFRIRDPRLSQKPDNVDPKFKDAVSRAKALALETSGKVKPVSSPTVHPRLEPPFELPPPDSFRSSIRNSPPRKHDHDQPYPYEQRLPYPPNPSNYQRHPGTPPQDRRPPHDAPPFNHSQRFMSPPDNQRRGRYPPQPYNNYRGNESDNPHSGQYSRQPMPPRGGERRYPDDRDRYQWQYDRRSERPEPWNSETRHYPPKGPNPHWRNRGNDDYDRGRGYRY